MKKLLIALLGVFLMTNAYAIPPQTYQQGYTVGYHNGYNEGKQDARYQMARVVVGTGFVLIGLYMFHRVLHASNNVQGHVQLTRF